MSVIQVANQIIMFLTPTYILDHILGFVGGVSHTHQKKTIENSKQKTLFNKPEDVRPNREKRYHTLICNLIFFCKTFSSN